MSIRASFLVLMTVALSACGSASYSDSARSAVQSMKGAIQTYNSASPGGLADTGSACHAAQSKIQDASALQKTAVPAQYAATAASLRQAYVAASAGFRDCETAAAQGSYPLMYKANSELATANAWIVKASGQDH